MPTRKQVVDQALSWIGATEGDGLYEHIMDIFNSNHQGYRYDGEGCSEFACACALAFGQEGEDAIFVANWAQGLSNQYKNAGRFYTDYSQIKIGDFVFWNTGSGDIDHTEIIVGFNGSHLWTVDGNDHHSVQRYDCPLPKGRIVGYGRNLFSDEEPQPIPYDFNKLLKSSISQIRLEEGMTSPLVSLLQTYLAHWGHYDRDITGHFGSGTADSVRRWQAKNNELGIYDGDITGAIGGKSWDVILKGLDANDKTYQEDKILKWFCANIPIAAGSELTEIVKLIQSYLGYYNYYPYEIDGIFGNGTQEAVMKWQMEHYLPSDGIINEDDWSVILRG